MRDESAYSYTPLRWNQNKEWPNWLAAVVRGFVHPCKVINPLEKNGTHGFDYSFELPLNQPVETIEIRYFSRETGEIYVASGIEANKKDVILLLNPIPFK